MRGGRPEHAGRRWRPTPDTAIGLTALILAVGGGGYALGAAGNDQVITACVDPANSQPAKIVTTGACDPGQTALSWNQTGPQGPVGATGVQGPAGPPGVVPASTGDATVVALPPKPSLRRKGRFTVSLELPGPGTFQVDGHVRWQRGALSADAPVTCEITRTQPVSQIDRLDTTILKDDPFGVSTIDEGALTTVTAAASTGSQTVVQVATPVVVTFGCTARLSPTRSSVNGRVLFSDWTLTATPVRVSVVKKKG